MRTKRDLIEQGLIQAATDLTTEYKYQQLNPHEIGDYSFISQEVNNSIEKTFKPGVINVRTRGNGRNGNFRIGIYGEGKSWFIALEYKDNGILAEAQVFNEEGTERLIEIKKYIDKRIQANLKDFK